MSKEQSGQEKKQEKPQQGKPEEQHQTTPSVQPKNAKSKGNDPALGGCVSIDCKAQGKRFGFCEEHYEQFKFGLIRKTGEPASDYEKKFEQYTAYKNKTQRSQKAA